MDFPDLGFGEPSAGDYQALGFMAGLEVHQQLLTRSKLFCRCPSGQRVDGYDGEVLRHMRPTLSELGEYDGTALMEFKTRKEIVYRLDRGSSCTYEIDDTPPFEIDQEAVRLVLEIATLLNLNLVSELHVMRKQYLDGSIPAGFQRTAMVGLKGTIPFKVPELGVDRELRIRQLSLEEDSCREVSDVGHWITFQTDRLGTPLVETVTEPDFQTPLELQAGARLLALVARATGKVRRGPGAARQDVNVSVAGGRRVEIKGVDNHRGLPRLVHIEAFRQLNLLRIKAELERRGIRPELLDIPEGSSAVEESPLVVDAAPTLRRCDFAPVREAIEHDQSIYALRLPGFAGLMNRSTQPGVTFGREFEDRIRVIACPEHRPFMIHSDMGDEGWAGRPWGELEKELKAESGDAVVVVWGEKQDADTAVRELFLRAQDALVGVPAETRQAFRDGTNGFERILPGPDRMYPDTDTPPLPIRDSLVTEIGSALPETPWAREKRYQELGLDANSARRLAALPWADLFDDLSPKSDQCARRLAAALEKRIPYHLRLGRLSGMPDSTRLAPMVRAVESGEIRPEAMDRMLDDLVQEKDRSVEEVLARYRSRENDLEELERVLQTATALAGQSTGKPAEAILRWAMGEVMPRFVGRLDPEWIQDQLSLALAENVPEVQHD